VETPKDEWRERQSEHLSGDRWIADGNYAATLDLPFERADTIIVLAPSRWTCTYRALRRCITNRGRAIQSPGCPERLDLVFLLWVRRYPSQTRPLLDAALEQFGRADVLVELKRPTEVRAFLDGAAT
jgi:adenylate kinase family enzyme